jgi:glucose-6-phosphate isomerase
MVAASSAVPLVTEFGIDPANIFGFWDWVGGRYRSVEALAACNALGRHGSERAMCAVHSVCSAVGILPLSLQYGFDVAQDFLAGARNIDEHFLTAPFRENIPVRTKF